MGPFAGCESLRVNYVNLRSRLSRRSMVAASPSADRLCAAICTNPLDKEHGFGYPASCGNRFS